MKWAEFAEAAPELAALGERRFAENRLGLIGTLRKDGSPRISPVEVFFVDGEPLLGMMWRSKKALDLLRDPRVVVHSATSDPDGSEGDVKLYGRAVDVRDPRVRQRYADVLEEKISWRPPNPSISSRWTSRAPATSPSGRSRWRCGGGRPKASPDSATRTTEGAGGRGSRLASARR